MSFARMIVTASSVGRWLRQTMMQTQSSKFCEQAHWVALRKHAGHLWLIKLVHVKCPWQPCLVKWSWQSLLVAWIRQRCHCSAWSDVVTERLSSVRGTGARDSKITQRKRLRSYTTLASKASATKTDPPSTTASFHVSAPMTNRQKGLSTDTESSDRFLPFDFEQDQNEDVEKLFAWLEHDQFGVPRQLIDVSIRRRRKIFKAATGSGTTLVRYLTTVRRSYDECALSTDYDRHWLKCPCPARS